MKCSLLKKKGFTLVELLIVIALIAILSVAVLATINPIEQSNKAKDSTVQNDAAEVLNAYERTYANKQKYPWMEFPTVASGAIFLTVEDAVTLRSESVGSGLCFGASTAAYSSAGSCNTSGTSLGKMIESDELKPSFVGKSEFLSTTATNPQDALWTVKTASAGGGIYVCYIPKAKSNRQLVDKLYCITETGLICKVGSTCTGLGTACTALAATATTWGTPVLDGMQGMFRCVPE
jgi:prepilin-type N-terminal cleavage/methylation domain-containing protein